MSAPETTVHLALLRGVNVGGRTVPMAALRELWTSLGYTGVRTYLQSGNVVFRADLPPDAAALSGTIASRLGLDTTVVLRTGDDLARVVAANPFPGAGGTLLHVGFLLGTPDPEAAGALDDGRYAPEAAVLAGREVYFSLPDGMGRAKLPAYVGRRLGTPMTLRNWRTVEALAELSGA